MNQPMRLATLALAAIFVMSAASAEVVSDEAFQRADGQSESSGNWHALAGTSSGNDGNASAPVPHAGLHALQVAPVADAGGKQPTGDGWQMPSPASSTAPESASQPPSQTPSVRAQKTQNAIAQDTSQQATGEAATSDQPSVISLQSDLAKSAIVTAVSAPAISPSDAGTPVTEKQPFSLVAGEPLESQLMVWARRAGWKVLWNLPEDNNWIVPGDEVCGTDFEAAVSHVVDELASNGADVVGDSWRGNHTIVITQSGATE
jgi:hypothetical protein